MVSFLTQQNNKFTNVNQTNRNQQYYNDRTYSKHLEIQ